MGSKRSPCPKYPFPEFDLVDLIRKLGQREVAIHLRFDPLREKDNFTLIGPDGRIGDTDEPLEALCEWVVGQSEVEFWASPVKQDADRNLEHAVESALSDMMKAITKCFRVNMVVDVKCRVNEYDTD